MDVAVGLAIHESMHVIESRDIYRRMSDTERDPRLKPLENLIEDWRIEEICRQEFPGYAAYLYKLRRVLIVDLSLRKAIGNWDFLPDVDKIMTIVSAYIRAPDLLAELPELQRWTDLQDRNIYELMRKHLAQPPSTEKDVASLARLILHLIDDYRDRSLHYLVEHGKLNVESSRRLRDQERANAFDESISGQHDPLSRRRFSLTDLAAAQVMDDSVRKGSSENALDRVRQLDRETSQNDGSVQSGDEQLPEQKIPPDLRGQIKLIKFPHNTFGRQNYDLARQTVRNHISRIKHAFRIEEGGRGTKDNRISGKLNRRRLYRAPFDPAVFSETTVEEPGKVLVALLLDASASMSGGRRYMRAIEVAAMFNEAFVHHPHITLHTYSHTSSETDDRCSLAYHGEASVRARESIGSIEPQYANYDYQAIWGVVAHLSNESAGYAKRILLSISDGRPCVPYHSLSSGVEITRKAVSDIRRQGWMVFGVGIGAYHADLIYGQRWTVNVPYTISLPSNMSSLLVRLMRR